MSRTKGQPKDFFDGKEKTCYECKRKFLVFTPLEYVYKKKMGVQWRWYCSYTCWMKAVREYEKIHKTRRRMSDELL